MSHSRRLLLVTLVCVATTGGCRSMCGTSWEVGEHEDPRERWREDKVRAESAQEWGLMNQGNIHDLRTKNAADFLARNPGASR